MSVRKTWTIVGKVTASVSSVSAIKNGDVRAAARAAGLDGLACQKRSSADRRRTDVISCNFGSTVELDMPANAASRFREFQPMFNLPLYERLPRSDFPCARIVETQPWNSPSYNACSN